MDGLKLILRVLRFVFATILLLTAFYISFLYINRLNIKPDQRYSSISLAIEPQAVSKAWMQVLTDSKFLYKHKRKITEIYNQSNANQANQEKRLQSAQTFIITHQDELNMMNALANESGCANEISHDAKLKLYAMNLLDGMRLLLIQLYIDRNTQDPNVFVDQVFKLFNTFTQKHLQCHHSLISFAIISMIPTSIQQVALPILTHPELEIEKRDRLIQALLDQTSTQSDQARIRSMQNAMRVDYHTIRKLLDTGLLASRHNVTTLKELESIAQFRPFWDAEQFEYWLKESYKASIWLLQQPLKDFMESNIPIIDLAISSIKKSKWLLFTQYNPIGQLLLSIVYSDTNSIKATYLRNQCRARLKLAQILDKLDYKFNPMTNPLTTQSLDPLMIDSCD